MGRPISQRRLGEHDELPHTLMPLALAAGLVLDKLYAGRPLTGRGREDDLNALAGFIAGMTALYEFFEDPSTRPRALERKELEGGLFRGGGRELRFIDGRPAKRYLAVSARELEHVMALLMATRRPRP